LITSDVSVGGCRLVDCVSGESPLFTVIGVAGGSSAAGYDGTVILEAAPEDGSSELWMLFVFNESFG
jgi:hypothetical protein